MARAPSTRAFEQVITLAIAKAKPPEVQQLHAKIAREGLAKHLASLSSRPTVRRIVDGRIGAAEETVRPYGVIRYEFESLREAAIFARAELQQASPVRSGRYAGNWFFLVNGAHIESLDAVAMPEKLAEVTISNDQPYSRRLAVGKRADGRPFSLQNLPPGYMEVAAQAVRARFGNSVYVEIRFIKLIGGYVLKSDYRATRRDRAGQQITYPSLVLKVR
jgi:hypothetical protein